MGRYPYALAVLAGIFLGVGCGDDVNSSPVWVYFSTSNSGLPSDNVYSISRRGDETWFACAGGLACHSPGQWRVYDRGFGMPSDDVFAVIALPDGCTWAGTAAGAVRLRGGEIKTYTVEDGLPSDRVVAVAYDDRYVWLGTDGGLARYDGSNFFVFDEENGLPLSGVRDIWVVGVGRVWVAGVGGAAYIEGDTVRPYTLANTQLPSAEVNAVTVRGEDVWLGTAAGLCLLRGGAVVGVFNTGNSSLAGDVVNDLGWRGDELWVATTAGVSRRQGEGFETFRVGNGMPADYVLAAVGDEYRQMWLGTLGGGVARFFQP